MALGSVLRIRARVRVDGVLDLLLQVTLLREGVDDDAEDDVEQHHDDDDVEE